MGFIAPRAVPFREPGRRRRIGSMLQLLHHAPDVILYSKLRQVKTHGNFFVRSDLRPRA